MELKAKVQILKEIFEILLSKGAIMLVEISGFSEKSPNHLKWDETLKIDISSDLIISSGILVENTSNNINNLQKGIENYPGAYDIYTDKFIALFQRYLSDNLIKKIKDDYVQVEFLPDNDLV